MGDLLYLADFANYADAAGSAVADSGAEAGAAAVDATSSNVSVDTSSVPEAAPKSSGDKSVAVTPKPKKTPAPQAVKQAVESVSVPDISDLPTPGGIAYLLIFIVLILFAFMPAGNGQTRLSTLWAVVRGQYTFGGSGSSSNSNSTDVGGTVFTHNADGSETITTGGMTTNYAPGGMLPESSIQWVDG